MERKLHSEGGAAAGGVNHFNAALMSLNNARDDRQPETAATGNTCSRSVGAPKALKNFLPDLRWNAFAVINDGDHREVVVGVDANSDLN